MAGIDNLRPVKTKEEARERGRNGGKRSGEAKREKKILTDMYIRYWAKKHDIEITEGKKKTLGGQELFDAVASKILSRGDSASNALFREMREGIEGSKITGEIEFSDPMKIIERHMQKINADKNESR